MAAKIFATYSLKKGKPLGPYGAFFYGLGGQPLWGQQKASKLEEAAGHIADFTFPFGMLFLLALAACNWNGCAEPYFPSSGLAVISKHHLTSGLNSTGVVSSHRRLPTHLELARATQVAFGAPCKSIG